MKRVHELDFYGEIKDYANKAHAGDMRSAISEVFNNKVSHWRAKVEQAEADAARAKLRALQ